MKVFDPKESLISLLAKLKLVSLETLSSGVEISVKFGKSIDSLRA
jgi:hypothetical protein